MRYRRVRIAGAAYFFTVVAAQRRPVFLDDRAVRLLGEAMRKVRAVRPFRTEAICVLPDHLHCIWQMPPEDADYSTRWRLIKTHFARTYGNGAANSPWQKRFWEHLIRDDDDFRSHVDYIHYNPVKHGYVQRAVDWPCSSFHRWVRLGHYTPDWAADPESMRGAGRE
jgi:putative transposase